jgi:tRNA modification GTPase
VDEVVAWVYRGPESYTGEDLVEFSGHGGAVGARRILDSLYRAGARPAAPGEFTRRAFLNGRLDLAQAEAVADLIGARGRRAQELALAQLAGGLSARIGGVAGRIREVLAGIEAHLDFGEDVPEMPEAAVVAAELVGIGKELAGMAATYSPARRSREGLTMALAGRPNVGKSSLLNALCGFDRALVHSAPGTTRDVVDAVVEWAGVPVRLVDTAGMRETPEEVEAAGVARGRKEIRLADRVLWVVDGSSPPSPEDQAIAGRLDFSRVHMILNKADLGQSAPGWENTHSPRSRVVVSCRTGAGIGELIDRLTTEIQAETGGDEDREDGWVTSARHAGLVAEAVEAVGRAREILLRHQALELAAADLQQGLRALRSVTGEEADQEVLDAIFSRFCIGK